MPLFIPANHHLTVNELSTTIDLESTLIRAEALFKRFHRLVDAIDKKDNFPAPRRRISQPPPSESTAPGEGASTEPASQSEAASGSGSGSASAGANASSSGNTAKKTGKAPAQQSPPKDQQKTKQPERVLTPELRKLLSREVEVLPRREVAKKGDGLGGVRGR